MTAKRKRAKPKSGKLLDAKEFAGVTGFFRQWANLGIIGVMAGLCVWAVTVGLPMMQDKFHSELNLEREAARIESDRLHKAMREEREAARLDAQKRLDHGTTAAKAMADAIKEQTIEIVKGQREQTNTIIENQHAVRINQAKLIDLQEKLLKAGTK